MEPLYAEIHHALSNLRSWLEPVQTPVPLALAPAVSEYVYEAYGVVFIMGAFNYPISLVVCLCACMSYSLCSHLMQLSKHLCVCACVSVCR